MELVRFGIEDDGVVGADEQALEGGRLEGEFLDADEYDTGGEFGANGRRRPPQAARRD
jgi:hypothetical protein